MIIRNIEELKREKLRLHFEKELAELELKASLDSFSRYKKPANLVESLLNALPFKNAGAIASLAALGFKLFTKKK